MIGVNVMEFGFKVKMKFSEASPFKGAEQTLRNVTEIHYKYPSVCGNSVAFESDVHQTGLTYQLGWIAEFEAITESEKAEKF